MEISLVVSDLVKRILAPIVNCWTRHRGVNKSMHELYETLKRLNDKKEDIICRMNVDFVAGETTLRDEVMDWLATVEKLNEEVTYISKKAEKVKFFSRARIGRKILRKKQEVKELSERCQFSDGLVISLPRRGDVLPTVPVLGGETTFRRKIEEIWACLADDLVAKIGVYGQGGIGKTTALKHINNRLIEERHMFDIVIWVTVSNTSTITSLQDKLASELDFDISYVDETLRAAMLYSKFMEKKRYVLILDNLSEAFSLAEVGIPEPTSQNGCKLVLTTRSIDVCHMMACRTIKMEFLPEDEALKLFLDTIGHGVSSDPKLGKIIEQIARECAGLPLGIVAIAGSLRHVTDYEEFEIALDELRELTKSSTLNGVYEIIKFSFDRLRHRNLQDCFLYCALYPEDYEIERDFLIEHLIAEGIIEGKEGRQYKIRMGHAMLNKLVNACLLNDTINFKGEKCVKMHKMGRDMALQMTTVSPRFLVKAGVGLKSIPDQECWNDGLVKVSLMCSNISDIPPSIEPPICPRLSTLQLCKNDNLRKISDNFFLHMKGLKILDLSYNYCLENFPESISELVALTALFLRGCSLLRFVPSLAKLRELRKLDFKGTGIKDVPQGIEMLVKLRYLNLDAENLKMIPDGILCNLSNLQYISLNRYRDGPKLRAEELESMRMLETFEGVLFDISSFNAYVRSLENGRLLSYVLQLGFINGSPCIPVDEGGKVVYLTNFDLSEHDAAGSECSLLLPQDAEILAIQRCKINKTSLCELASFENVTNLRWCWISDCGDLEYLISCSSSAIHLLQKLERLDLEGVRELRGLIRRSGSSSSSSTLPPGTFSSLKVLRVRRCNNLKRLSITALFPSLEEISVLECEELVEIVLAASDDDEEEDQIEEWKSGRHDAILAVALPKLKDLYLSALPNLRRVPVVADSLQQVAISGCPNLKRIPFLDRDPCLNLQHVKIDEDSWQSLEWDHPDSKALVQSMRAQ